jgi:hypothetical protein
MVCVWYGGEGGRSLVSHFIGGSPDHTASVGWDVTS